jgi:endonuclease/exonuclease/phosphatase family metal-dependent hydrolase
VVCLQEVTPTTLPGWTEHLREAGLEHVAAGDPAAARAEGRSRPLLVLTAACVPLSGEDVPGRPWPERVLATRTGSGLLIVNVHSPISPKPDLVKVRTHEAVHAFLAAARPPALVCGDLNTPRKEHADGRVWTFARSQYGKLRPERGERWDTAELALIKGLEPHGFRDAFRTLYGLERRELSWEWPRWGGGYRLDHLIVSADVSAETVEYLHEWRRAGLSDHSPLWAELEVSV